MKTIIAAFTDNAAAQQGAELLRTRASSRNDQGGIELLVFQDAADDVLGELEHRNVPKDRAHLYAEVMRRGATVLVAEVPDDQARLLADELDRMGSLDLDSAQERWRSQGWNGYDNTTAFDAAAQPTEREALLQESQPIEAEVDVIEENVHVGKREVSRGGVRVRTFVVEQPVHESVRLREEHIDVTREPVNEPISTGVADSTFHEQEFEVTAQGEEAVVGKEARVVERVHVGKRVDTRTEEINETERRQDVEVEQIDKPPPSRR